MAPAATQAVCQEGDGNGRQSGEPIVGGKQDTHPVRALVVSLAAYIAGPKVKSRNCRSAVYPHREQRKPGEKLHHGQLLHDPRHVEQVLDDTVETILGLAF